ncbi:hypothetical protein FA10DRAFT_240597 [Acaromyces ingoldii]|uniref:PQ-loop-domain-containing protein n=1 Tax=Acaromyces ingoldii TaxID=215250 RepID=A0A316YKX1_9BASI|nr:hypothetical protein FA10DRAFT_240597 [Acaromyces ingoldii]PWN90037.1 hypothetical protein FA10DRAFT_240597 [Acaromyces ingoldii]
MPSLLLLREGEAGAGDQGHVLAEALSRLLGWSYFILWTASFWPQAILMQRTKTVAGMSIDFLYLNVVGFVAYTIFNLAFLLSPTVQEQYRQRHGGSENVVRWNDALFAIHALLIASWQVGQSIFFKRAPGQKLSRWAMYLIAILVSSLLVAFFLVHIDGASSFEWLDFVNACSYVKLVVTFVKYWPQIYLNWSRKSTRGFAILNILLDFTGGILSLLQLALDAQIINHDWSGVWGDAGKLGLSLLSLFFDVALLIQHYTLYGDVEVTEETSPRPTSDEDADERQALLHDERR